MALRPLTGSYPLTINLTKDANTGVSQVIAHDLPLLRGLAFGGVLALMGCAVPALPPMPSMPPPAALYGGARPTEDFQAIPYAGWGEDEPGYRLYPGDVLDFAAPSAPELNRTVTVQPDGRVTLPLVGQVMAADRSVPEFQATLSQAYAGQLRRPQIEITVKQASPLKVFVGGEVDKPGVYDMPGDIDAVQAVIMAGGFKTSAKRGEVLIVRRGPGGRPMMRTANLKDALYNPGRGDAVPLRRFDIVYVPRTGIANVGVFVQQYFRDTLPIQFSYAINGTYATTK
jgi:polysaccharide export outer membrane protein